MTIEDFDQLKRYLGTWPDLQYAVSPDHLLQRLVDAAWTEATDAVGSSRADVASLLHQVLRRESGTRGYSASLRVPKGLLSNYQHRGLIRHPDAADTELITSEVWSPSWLGSGTPAEAANAEAPRRRLRPVAADPFSVRVTGAATNLTISQRQAMRVAAVASPGSTTIVNLPTGWGKTSVALASALADAEVSGTTLFVVPTVALALDQERRTKVMVDHMGLDNVPSNFAYHGSLPSEQKDSIRQSIRDGTQRVVYASPESAVGGLSFALKDAASMGRIPYFVVDEAHMVSEWGGGFRPEFQALAGLRTALVDCAEDSGHQAPRTLLLSATYTQHSLDLLEALFGRNQSLVITGSNVIRPEPEYWVAMCDSPAEKMARVIEAVEMVPKPCIVYTTTREDASMIRRAIQERGIRRVAEFTGATGASERAEILDGWRPTEAQPATRYDIVVATSAFGLGVDLEHVRSVIHACVPESIDRFYQEVGRSGRDGRASLSILIYEKRDLEVGQGISNEIEKTIGPDKAWRRWQAMRAWKDSRPTGDTRLRVSLRARREDIPGPSERNEHHNRIVLSIMALAGMIELDDSVGEMGDLASLGDQDEPWAFQGIRILKGDLADETSWKTRFQAARESIIKARAYSWERMTSALNLDQELADLFADSYRVRDPSSGHTRFPETSCGGCAYGRRSQEAPFAGEDPGCPGPTMAKGELGPALRDMLTSSKPAIVHYPGDLPELDFEDLLRRAIRAVTRHGLKSIVVAKELRGLVEDALAHTMAPYFIGHFSEIGASGELLRPRMPELVVLRGAHSDVVRNALRPWPYGRVVLIADDYPDPSKPNVSVSDLRRPSWAADALVRRL